MKSFWNKKAGKCIKIVYNRREICFQLENFNKIIVSKKHMKILRQKRIRKEVNSMGNLDKIGRSIRSLRKANKITLQQMASETGLSTGY